MKSTTRFLLPCLALLAPWSHAALPDASLAGCWRAVKIVRYAQGGPRMEDKSGRCTLQFKEDQLASTCETSAGTMTSTYRYRIVRPHVYAATMTGSTFKTDLIGSTREYEFHVDGDRLTTATSLKPASSAGSAAAVRVETEAAKMPCP
jgi:hypothetical protein